MSKPDPALILPISDLSLSRDTSSKLRLAGIITAINPSNSSLIVLSDPHPPPTSTNSSILVDISLCTSNASWKRTQPPRLPELKCKLMVIGHLTRHPVGIDIGWVENGPKRNLIEPQPSTSVQDRHRWLPNRYFILEAILAKPLDHAFDLKLWNDAARIRSQNEWSHYHSSLTQKAKGKRKASS